MANAEKLWESFDDILANQAQWNQRRYITGTRVIAAPRSLA